jgi:hypothetical protein
LSVVFFFLKGTGNLSIAALPSLCFEIRQRNNMIKQST